MDRFGPLGHEIDVYTWLHHHEDGMRLFGFPTQIERSLFLDLQKVEGIGPKQALKILSGMSPDELAMALEQGDLSALQRISGVGPKLAQKMVLALKGRLVEEQMSPGKGFASGQNVAWADVVKALVDMGFDRRAVETSVTDNSKGLQHSASDEKELFRRVLVELSAGVKL
jgi:Holliday junction DNA helicase RuvA